MTEHNFYPLVNKPGRYLGHEHNSTTKDWTEVDVRFALIFPDLYEIGMSHQGLQILYHIINNQGAFVAERCYCPDKDLEKILDDTKTPLSSLESGHALCDFDILAITLPYELCFTNILTILKQGHIPWRSADRDDSYPLILGGGSCAMNPEPVADFFDAILLGDGEEAILEIGACVQQAKQQNVSKQELLTRLSAIEGVYIPSFFEPHYNEDGTIGRITATAAPEVQRRIVADLSQTDHLLRPLVPHAKIVHDRLGVEIARGCTRGCRFCQAGMTYRPVRERSPEQIVDIARCGIDNSGFNELALLSLSTGDYSCLDDVLPQLMDSFASDFVSVAMPSMRVGTLTQSVMDQIRRVRKTGFTLAPEAGSERLRQVINKGISEEDLLKTSRDAFALGWKVMKLYFMIGLPTETQEDIDAIVRLAQKTKNESAHSRGGKKQINVSIGTFVPKPHTPFQWEKQLTIAESTERIFHLKNSMPRKGFNLKWHDPKQSFLEGVFSRGDRRLSHLLEQAWHTGARLDGWSDHYSFELWQQAAQECAIDLDFYLRARDLDEILPWHHLQTGIDVDFFKQELDNARNLSYTPDCRYHGCQQCGLCDFKTIKPRVFNKKKFSEPQEQPQPIEQQDISQPRKPPQREETQHFKYLLTYARRGDICYLGHLEILQLFFRAMRRAKLTTNFSLGFNPSPKVSFGPALPVGTESDAEYCIIDVPELIDNLTVTTAQLNDQLPDGITVKTMVLHSGKIPQAISTHYRLTFQDELTDDDRTRVEEFTDTEEFLITRYRKGRRKEIDMVPLVKSITITSPNTIEIDIISRGSEPGVKPLEAVQHILGRDADALLATRVLKTGWKATDPR